MRIVCQRACECTTVGTECALASSDGSGSISFDDENACYALASLSCGAPAAGMVNWNRCASEASAAACVEPGSGGAGSTPMSCDVP